MNSITAIIISLIVCMLIMVSMVFSVSNYESANDGPGPGEKLYGDEETILKVSEKLKVDPEEVTFELGEDGELYYSTMNGTYFAEFNNGEVEYLMEVIK